VHFEGSRRIHIGLEVADLERSIAFDRLLLGEEPVKLRADHAKFEPREPALNLSLSPGPGGRFARPGSSQRFGIQVDSSAAVDRMIERFREAAQPIRVEREITCCDSVQDKVWAEDPDGNPWEVFVVVQAQADRRSPAASACCAP
jgi:catechol 2,3-dioxygenase-like lactoylglutathione lyase family enzyme